MTDQNKEPQEGNQDYFARLNQERDELKQGHITDTVFELTEKARESAGITEYYTSGIMRGGKQLRESLEALKGLYAEYIKSDEWAKLCELYPEIEPLDALFISYIVPDLIEYEPEIKELIKKRQRKEGRPISFRALLYDPDPKDMDRPLIEALLLQAQRIRERKGLPKVKYEPAEDQQIRINIDKGMRALFNPRMNEKAKRGVIDLMIRDPEEGSYKRKRGEIPGQLSFLPISYEKEGEKEITLYYALDYDRDMLKKLGLPEETTSEDFFILSFIANAARTGGIDVSANKLYKDLTGKEPNERQRTQFVERLMKMAGTMIDFDDREVMEAWGQETYNQYYGQLAPLEFINERFTVNGGVANCRIRINSFPRVLQTGQRIGQYTTIPKSLLHVTKRDKNKKLRAVRRTPRFYELLMILIKEIAMIKNPGTPRANKITYSWLFKELDIDPKGPNDYDARREIKETLFVILDHFKREGWITGYEEDAAKSTGEVGIKFTWDNAGGKGIADKKKTQQKAARGKKDNPRH